MYRDRWDPNALATDFKELASLGANVARIFLFTPDFMPAPDVVSEQSLERLSSTIELAGKAGLWSIPTLLVGHMSGENWDPDWSRGRNWYTDPLLLDASELLLGTVASHFAGDQRIAAWLITNEWPLFAGMTSSEHGLRWAKRLSAVLRAADPDCNLSLGDGAWDAINGQPNGLESRALREVVDFYGPHFYPKETDSLRHSAFAAFAMRMTAGLGRPVVLEEFGCSSDQADDDLAAGYYRTVLWSAFGAGNCGTLVWNSHDFTVTDRPPYSHHPYELHFGLIRTDGSFKPQANEVKRFAGFVSSFDPDAWEPQTPSVAIGRTSYYFGHFPFDWGWTKMQLRDIYLQTYAGLVAAGIDSVFTDLANLEYGATKLVAVPCLQQVTTADAEQLERFARMGGTVYLSYGGEPWFPDLARFIGARPLIRYGLVTPPPRDSVRVKLVCDFGGIAQGDEFEFAPRDPRLSAPLTCEPREAAVVATDQAGNAAMLEHKFGSGRVIFLTYPLEYFLLGGLDANAHMQVWKLYEAIASSANVLPAIRSTGHGLQTFAWKSKRNREVRRLLIVNHGWDAVDAKMAEAAGQLVDVESGERFNNRTVPLEAKGVRILEFTLA
jgi:hypothetical protein